VSGDLLLEANQPNTEVFINVGILFGLFFLFGKLRGVIPWQQAILAGLCFAAASFYKHVIVVIPLAAGLACIACPRPDRTRRAAFFDVVIVGLVGITAWLALFAYFWGTGRLKGMIDCLFRYNLYYSGDQKDNLLRTLSPSLLFPSTLYHMIPLFCLAMGGMIAGFARRQWFPWVPMVGVALGTVIAVEMPGHFFAHYYQLWIPFLLLGTALTIGEIELEFSRFKWTRLIAPLVLASLFAAQVPSYFYSAADWSYEKYGAVFVVTDKIATNIREWLKPEETFYQLDAEPQLYFDTGRRPLCALSVYGVFQQSLHHGLSEKTIHEVMTLRPDLLVIGKFALKLVPLNSPFRIWIRSNYSMSPLEPDYGLLFLCVRNGSALESRLAKQRH